MDKRWTEWERQKQKRIKKDFFHFSIPVIAAGRFNGNLVWRIQKALLGKDRNPGAGVIPQITMLTMLCLGGRRLLLRRSWVLFATYHFLHEKSDLVQTKIYQLKKPICYSIKKLMAVLNPPASKIFPRSMIFLPFKTQLRTFFISKYEFAIIEHIAGF